MMLENTINKDERVRIVYHPAYQNNYPTASCEIPERTSAVMDVLREKFSVVEPDACTEDDILLCHSQGLIYAEQTMSERFKTAKLAAGGAIKAFDLAMDGYVSFAAVRPPGHHSSPDSNWGFCFFNNISIAVMRGLSRGMIDSAVILDIDLHYGDGTENIFKFDKRVRVLNIGSGTPSEFIRETRESLADIHGSGILAISAGFDQYEKDWGANLSTDDYRVIGELAAEFARDKTGGRLFAVLEGGYYIPDLGMNALALIEGMNSV